MSVPKLRLALFDLDHTLLPIDSDYAWGVFTQDIGWCDPVAFKQRNDEFYEHYKAGTLDIRDYVRFATEALRLRGPAQAAAAHSRFMQDVIVPAIRAEALDLVRRHRDAGEQPIIVTATNEFITRPIASAFGVSELIAVQLERGSDGWITGEIQGVPSMREGKVERVAQWLAARGLGWRDVEATFYSDSMNDLPLLEAVDHPVATNPDVTLRAIAGQRGWRILDLFK
ncbi:MAG TPA: HAD family hydrolase [Ramlibacter sp.]|nr:HAD family hydrolase [Ramlibacter sp.]